MVRINRAPIATKFTLPRFLMPIRTQTMIRAPTMRLHTQLPPICRTESAAKAALAIMTAVQPTN